MKRTLFKKCSALLLMAAFLLTTLPAAAALATLNLVLQRRPRSL